MDENGTGSDCSLREAIITVNRYAAFGGCAAPQSMITFAPALTGTITLSVAPEPITQSVTITGPGASSLTVSGNNAQRVFEIAAANNPVVTIEKLTLTQGKATDASGGAILSTSAGMLTINSVTITNSTVTGIRGLGGGVYAYTARVSNSTLSGNSAGSRGGGIYANNTATVSNSTFSGNSARRGSGIIATNATVSNSTLSGNIAGDRGGGIYAATATVSNNTLSGNSAGNKGGGIYANNTATVSNSTLSGNSAGDRGGGINAINATVSNSTLSGNSASNYGGGIIATNATVSNSTIVLNRSNDGGGIRSPGFAGSFFVVNNTIVAGNTNPAGTTDNNISGGFTDGSNNLIGPGGSGGLTDGVNGNIVNATLTFAKLNTVLNTTLAANSTTIFSGDPNAPGGQQPVLTHALVSGSPAIDVGDNNLTTVTTDQRGLLQIVNTTVDIGAFEAQ